MGEGLSSSPFLQNIALFVVWVSQPAGTPIFFPPASDSNHKLTPIFTTSLGIAGSDNRDFAFILYAWLGYCCFSPLPWFSPFPGISPDFARYTGHRSAPEPRNDNWRRSRQAYSAPFERKGLNWAGFKWRTFNGRIGWSPLISRQRFRFQVAGLFVRYKSVIYFLDNTRWWTSLLRLKVVQTRLMRNCETSSRC